MMAGGGHSKGWWLQRHMRDAYVRQAKEHGFRSRASYKLLEINRQHRILQPGSVVVECGAAPGGWTQVATQAVNAPARGLVIAIDLRPLDPPVPEALFLQQDFTASATQETIRAILRRRIQRHSNFDLPSPSTLQSESFRLPPCVDVVLSDMAPNFSGNQSLDRLRTVGLAETALSFAEPLLKANGHFACKILQGPEVNLLRERMQRLFNSVYFEKPKSSRTESAEGFLVGCGYRRRVHNPLAIPK